VVVVALEPVVELFDYGQGVDELRGFPGHRVADDVAPGIATGLLGREAVGFEFLEDRRDVFEFDPVELDRLAGRPVDVAVAELGVRFGATGVLVGDLGDDLGLTGFQDAVGRADPQHEVAFLAVALVVQPPPFEALEPRVVFVVGDRLPALFGEPIEVLTDLVAVDLRFPSLDISWHVSVHWPHT